jgi:hypothetical protein
MATVQWSPTTLYGLYDAVLYQGVTYVSKFANNLNHVPTDTVWWAPGPGANPISSIVASAPLVATPPNLGEVSLSVAPGGIPTWQLAASQPSASYTTGQNCVNSVITIPNSATGPVPILVEIVFTSMQNADPPPIDSYVLIDNTGYTPTTLEWGPQYVSMPPTPGAVFRFTYTFVAPAGATGPRGIQALWGYLGCTCSSKIYICA